MVKTLDHAKMVETFNHVEMVKMFQCFNVPMCYCFNALMGQISKWPLGEIESPNGLVVAANG